MTTDPESTNWPPGWQQARDTDAGHQQPTVGRVVFWVDPNHRPWPALVVKADGTLVDLSVSNPLPIYIEGVAYDPNGAPGSWRWPERV